MADKFNNFSDSPLAPARRAVGVTPHDSNALSNVPKGLYVGGAGNIVCRLVDDSADLTFAAVPSGVILPIRVSYVRASGTTATSIVALF